MIIFNWTSQNETGDFDGVKFSRQSGKPRYEESATLPHSCFSEKRDS